MSADVIIDDSEDSCSPHLDFRLACDSEHHLLTSKAALLLWHSQASDATMSMMRLACRRLTYSHGISTAGRRYTSTAKAQPIDIALLLSKPAWSVSSLLSSAPHASVPPEISSKQLQHLSRLSALPPPKDAAEEASMLATLSSQLHFVKEIQKIDTTGVEPLRSLRDETAEGERSAELGMEALREALEKEEVRGKFHKRIRRKRERGAVKREDEWDVLGTTGKRTGKFFVVEGGKK